MSTRTKFAALACGAIAILAIIPLGASEAQAQQAQPQGRCGGHCVVAQSAGGHQVAPKYCHWAATGIHGGRTPTLQRVCVY